MLIACRGTSRDTRGAPSPPPTSAPLVPRDMNPVPPPQSTATAGGKLESTSLVIAPEGIQPASVAPERGQSSPSIVTVDAFAAQQASPPGHKTASSSAAKKVMEWFRKKSLAREHLSSLKQAGVKSDSASSFVQVSDSPLRHAARDSRAQIGSSANLAAMSSTSSVANTAEGPSALGPDVRMTPNKTTSDLPPPLMIPLPATAGGTPTDPGTLIRVPLASAANKANIETMPNSTISLVPPARNSMPLPSRSKSHMPTSENPTPNPSATPTKASPRLTSSPTRADELKMRVHTGLVDQSALSSKPPKEVMLEVMRVLQGMGMDIKKENDFKLRCTRVRRRKAGATTGLGLGSVISVGSGNPFTLMSSASTSKVSGPPHCSWSNLILGLC